MAELLVVVAIIAVLCAMSIPVLNKQLEKSREANDISYARSAYTEVRTSALMQEATDGVIRNGETFAMTFDLVQKSDGWTMDLSDVHIGEASAQQGAPHWIGSPKAGGSCTVSYSVTNGVIVDWNGTPVEPSNPDGGSGSITPTPPPAPTIPPAQTYPGTDITVVTSGVWPVWPDTEAWGHPETVSPSGIFQYKDGNYYVIYREQTIDQGHVPNGPSDVAGNETSTGWDFVVPLTGNVYDWDESKLTWGELADIKRGDIYKFADGSTYVFISVGGYAREPGYSQSSDQRWYRLS